jgi:hypothetical protein
LAIDSLPTLGFLLRTVRLHRRLARPPRPARYTCMDAGVGNRLLTCVLVTADERPPLQNGAKPLRTRSSPAADGRSRGSGACGALTTRWSTIDPRPVVRRRLSIRLLGTKQLSELRAHSVIRYHAPMVPTWVSPSQMCTGSPSPYGADPVPVTWSSVTQSDLPADDLLASGERSWFKRALTLPRTARSSAPALALPQQS